MTELRRCTDCGTPFDGWGARCNVCLQTKAIKEAAKQQADAANRAEWARESEERQNRLDSQRAEDARIQAEKDLWDVLNPNPAKKFDFSESTIIERQLLSANPSVVALDWKRCLDQINALKPTDHELLKRCEIWDGESDLTVSTLRYKMAWYFRSARGDIEMFQSYLDEARERLDVGAKTIETERIAAEEQAASMRSSDWYYRISATILLAIPLAVVGAFVYLIIQVYSNATR